MIPKTAAQFLFWLLVALFLVTIAIVMWKTFDDSLSNNELIGYLGIVLAQSVALAGLLIKDAVDQRSDDLATSSERRLVVETALGAVSILEANAAQLPLVRNAGAMAALTTLDQLPMALSLTDVLWRDGLLDGEAAIQVIDAALSSGDPTMQRSAAAILVANARLSFPLHVNEYYFPKTLNQGWEMDLPGQTRMSLFAYLLQVSKHIVDSEELDDDDLRRRLGLVVKTLLNLRSAKGEDEVLVSTAGFLLYVLLLPFVVQSKTLEIPGPGDDFTNAGELFDELEALLSDPDNQFHTDGAIVATDLRSKLTQRFADRMP